MIIITNTTKQNSLHLVTNILNSAKKREKQKEGYRETAIKRVSNLHYIYFASVCVREVGCWRSHPNEGISFEVQTLRRGFLGGED